MKLNEILFKKKIAKIIYRNLTEIIYRKYFATLKRCPIYAPNSAWNPKQRVKLLFQAANETFPSLVRWLKAYNIWNIQWTGSIDIDDFQIPWWLGGISLKNLFIHYWSDKSTDHNYHTLYSYILNRPETIKSILEIGIGTNNRDVVSNMGLLYKPGASLRAFRDYCINAEIYWADIDNRILFNENRIKTYQADQTSMQSLEKLSKYLPWEFDLIIDDGLHISHANINSLNFWLKKIKKWWWMIIEDIPERTLDIWVTIAAILTSSIYVTKIIKSKNDVYLFAVQKIA